MREKKHKTYCQALAESMDHSLKANENTVIMGQGVDDFKGIWGTTLNLHKKYGRERVFDLPLAEESSCGIALGCALNGLYPIQTHIRADFAFVAMNQIVNLLAKYRYMFGGRYEVPTLIRMIVGRSWGQGAQHSQSPQSIFSHIPGLTVIMPSHPDTILSSYAFAVEKYKNPVISIEHRLMYDLEFQTGTYQDQKNPLHSSYLAREGRDITIVATSIMVLEAQRAAEYLQKEAGISCEIIDLHSCSHPNKELVLSSISKTGKLLVADTSWLPYGVCAEISRWVCESNPSILQSPITSVGMAHAPCPTAKSLEDLFYPNLTTLCDQIASLAKEKSDHGIKLPDENSMADIYKRFKGPF